MCSVLSSTPKLRSDPQDQSVLFLYVLLLLFLQPINPPTHLVSYYCVHTYHELKSPRAECVPVSCLVADTKIFASWYISLLPLKPSVIGLGHQTRCKEGGGRWGCDWDRLRSCLIRMLLPNDRGIFSQWRHIEFTDAWNVDSPGQMFRFWFNILFVSLPCSFWSSYTTEQRLGLKKLVEAGGFVSG